MKYWTQYLYKLWYNQNKQGYFYHNKIRARQPAILFLLAAFFFSSIPFSHQPALADDATLRTMMGESDALKLYIPLIHNPLPRVAISEFMASNSVTIYDEDGDSSDWIELHNAQSSVVRLDGWYLTDDPSDLTKWQLPNIELLPRGRLLVFASGKDRTDAKRALHTNFRLSSSGEYLALVAGRWSNDRIRLYNGLPHPIARCLLWIG